MAKVALSYGHDENTYETTGGKGVKVGGKVYEEYHFNKRVGEKVNAILKAHDVTTLVVSGSLSQRTKKANDWDADIYWSIHANAGDAKARGIAGFYWSSSAGGKKLAVIFAKYLKEAKMPLYSGGTYASQKGTWSDFHELRETNMVAILTENGFMTNGEDFKLIFLDAGDFDTKLSRIHSKSILEYLKVKYDPIKSGEKKAPVVKETEPKKAVTSDKLHRVQVGAYADRKNAESLVAKLKKDGYTATIV